MSAHERTGWRDAELSARHREWGVDCPAVDLDFLLLEYNVALPVCLIEYKHYKAQTIDLDHSNYRALIALADRGEPLPFFAAYYWPRIWAFRVVSLNAKALEVYRTSPVELTERRFVSSLYWMRGLVVKEKILAKLQDQLPPSSGSR